MDCSQLDSTTYIFRRTLEDAARLNLVNRVFNDLLGGVFPHMPPLSACHRILDLACGPGGWIFDVKAFLGSTPDVSLVGIDSSQTMIEIAKEEAHRRGQSGCTLPNVAFHVMDVLKPLEFKDASFDYIHARLLSSFAPASSWPALLQEWERLLRPEGVLEIIEAELPVTTSFALENLSFLLAQAYFQTGKSNSRLHTGVTAYLQPLLVECGYREIRIQPMCLDLRSSQAHNDMVQIAVVGLKLLEGFLIESGVVSQQEFDSLYEQAINEILSDPFGGYIQVFCIWGQKAPC